MFNYRRRLRYSVDCRCALGETLYDNSGAESLLGGSLSITHNQSALKYGVTLSSRWMGNLYSTMSSKPSQPSQTQLQLSKIKDDTFVKGDLLMITRYKLCQWSNQIMKCSPWCCIMSIGPPRSDLWVIHWHFLVIWESITN